jgi:biopolymer transport protein ExbB
VLPDSDSWLRLLTIGSLPEFFAAGGWVLWWIFGAALVLWTLILERYWFFARVFPRQLAALETIWESRRDHRSWYARRIRSMLISRVHVAMGMTLPMMQVVIPLCPLLGLMGTVLGMLEVFDMMKLQGRVDARTMASGVSQAMICTLAGLGVSISGMYFVHRLQARVRHETEALSEHLVIAR